MISDDVDHGIHGLFPCAVAAGSFLVIIMVSGLFVTNFALIGCVHEPHEVMITPMSRLSVSDKHGVFLFCEGSGRWYSQCEWYLLQCDALAL